MVYLWIKNWKEETKTSEFQHHIGGTAVCMKILTRGKKCCCQLTSNKT